MNAFCDKIWEDILSEAKKWQENNVVLKTLGKGKMATRFTIIDITPHYLTTSVYRNKYSKDIFCLALLLLRERGKAGTELRPIKTSRPTIGTIDYAVRPKNVKGKIPPMRATWIGAILVRSAVAIQTKDRPITIRLADKYLALGDDLSSSRALIPPSSS